MMKISHLAIAIAAATSSSIALAANVAPSQQAPGNIATEQAPQFIAIAFDDNNMPAGQQWVLDTFASLSNPAGTGNLDLHDGQPLHTTFFNSCSNIDSTNADAGWNAGNVKSMWYNAQQAGHEMANHTIDHLWGGSWMDVNVWTAQIGGCNDAMARPYNPETSVWAPNNAEGIGATNIGGFRTPYLDYNPAMFETLQSLGFRYDASLAEGYQWDHHGGNAYWPYTLDNGAPGADLQASWGLKPQLGNYPGLWEVPIYAFIVPSDEQMQDYGFDYSLRDKIKGIIGYFDTASGKMESGDYNLFYQLGLTGPEVLSILKNSLDLRLDGNRAPMTFLAHSHNYDDQFDAWVPTTTTAAERRKVITDFLDYALSNEAVRVVSHNELLDWMEAPKALNANHCYHQDKDWSTGRAYEIGTQVMHGNALWESAYWSYNTAPQVEQWGPWTKVMDCE